MHMAAMHRRQQCLGTECLHSVALNAFIMFYRGTGCLCSAWHMMPVATSRIYM